jgi:hypothetical protein
VEKSKRFSYLNGYEYLTRRELLKELQRHLFIRLDDECSTCRGHSYYVLFLEENLEKVLEIFPWLSHYNEWLPQTETEE